MNSNIYLFFPQATNKVKVKGEPLGKILWKGTQWAVTEYGLECRDGLYAVSHQNMWANLPRAPRNQEITKDSVFHYWFVHIRGKDWCDKFDLYHAMHAFVLLFDQNGRRENVFVPILKKEDDDLPRRFKPHALKILDTLSPDYLKPGV
jgi:hypothetical protein